MTTTETRTTTQIVDEMVRFMETGVAPDRLFAADSFCDLTMPLWRLQAQGRDGVIGLRNAGHPDLGSVGVTRWAPTPDGFVLEFTESWRSNGEDWTCREMLWATVTAGSVTDLSVYCTGDWDTARRAEHARAVTLIRP